MIERQTVDGRQATVAYLDDSFELVSSVDEATLVKVRFDDGEVLFLVPKRDAGEADGQDSTQNGKSHSAADDDNGHKGSGKDVRKKARTKKVVS